VRGLEDETEGREQSDKAGLAALGVRARLGWTSGAKWTRLRRPGMIIDAAWRV
jgi:hypothetical protein